MKNGQRTCGESNDGLSLEEAMALLERAEAFEAQGRTGVALHIGGVSIVPIEVKPGDYAELVDANGKPIPPGYNPNPDTTKWWVRCSSKDDVLVWLLPFAAWQKLRDIAAARWHGIP